MTAPMWMIRAGEGGYLAPDFANGFVAIGWQEIGDLSTLKTPDAIRAQYERAFPNAKPGRVANAVAVLHKFRSVLKPGDQVITYDPQARLYLLGEITTDYSYKPGQIPDSPHIRGAKWKGQVSRDRLSPRARNSLGSTLTLFSIDPEVQAELLTALGAPAPPAAPDAIPDERADLEEIKEDTIARARELIKDKLLSLDDEEMPQLVAALLRAMGYKTRIMPRGPDRGVDVHASPDGLGLEQPRIKVEVKHRSASSMGSQEIRSFLGGLRETDRGLYVSSGGFSKDAKYEADRSTVPVTLIDLEELTNLVLSHYDQFDAEGRLLLPLVRIYWPAE